MLHLRDSSSSGARGPAENPGMAYAGEFRFSKGGYSLYAQLGARTGGSGVVYAVYDACEQLMDELPSLGEACALIERLVAAPAACDSAFGGDLHP